MRTLIATLIASTVSMVAFQAAHAADAIEDVPQAPAAEYSEPVASGNWAGAYAGGTASWQRGERQLDFGDANHLVDWPVSIGLSVWERVGILAERVRSYSTGAIMLMTFCTSRAWSGHARTASSCTGWETER